MDTNQKLEAIYEAMSNDGEPVRIGDILKYVDTHHYAKIAGMLSRDMAGLNNTLAALFYYFVGRQHLTLAEQDEDCIHYVYSLINK